MEVFQDQSHRPILGQRMHQVSKSGKELLSILSHAGHRFLGPGVGLGDEWSKSSEMVGRLGQDITESSGFGPGEEVFKAFDERLVWDSKVGE
jgi:hypothetical protein